MIGEPAPKCAPQNFLAQGKRMDMSAEEIKQFWRGFCQRRKISADVVAKGEAIIDKDPDYWADQTMGDLLDSISGKKPS